MYKNATTTKKVLIDRRLDCVSSHQIISDSDRLKHAYQSAKYFLVPRYLTINELNCVPKLRFDLLFSYGANFLFSRGYSRALISTLPDWFVCFVGHEKIFNFLKSKVSKDSQVHPSLVYLKMSLQELKLIAQTLKSKETNHNAFNSQSKLIGDTEKARLRKIKASQHYKS
jgi:hypothetical protein